MGDGKPENLNDPEQEEEEEALSLSEESPSSELFEFFIDLSTEMCPAEDIIISGKILPLNCKDQQQLQLVETTRSKTPTRLISHSLDNNKLHQSSSSDPPVIERNSSVKSNGKSYAMARTKSPKSPWYLLMFGFMKFPPEMDLIDIKTRKVRRNSSAMFPPLEPLGKVPVRSKGSWRLFNVLSCKDNASISVTTPFGNLPIV